MKFGMQRIDKFQETIQAILLHLMVFKLSYISAN
jgi:hypothetical protein